MAAPIASYSDLVAVYAEQTRIYERFRELRATDSNHEEFRALAEESHAIGKRIIDSPECKLLRSIWCVEHWTAVEDAFDDDYDKLQIDGLSLEASDIISIGRTLVDELRRLRPELG